MSIERAAFFPSAIALIAIRGPNAASPPVKTPGAVVASVSGSMVIRPPFVSTPSSGREEREVSRLADGDDDGLGGDDGLGPLDEFRREAAALVEDPRDRQELDSADLAVLADEPLRADAVPEPDPFPCGLLDLLDRGGHLRLRLEAADRDAPRAEADRRPRHVERRHDGEVPLEVLLLAAADGGARHVERDVPSADDEDLGPHLDPVAEVDVQEVVDSPEDAVELHAGHGQVPAPHGAHTEKDGRVAAPPQLVEREVAAEARVRLELDSEREDGVDLELDQRPGEPVLGHPQAQHPARHGRGLEDRDRVTEEREVVRAGEARRPRADHGHSLGVAVPAVAVDLPQDLEVDHALHAEALGHEPLQRPDGDRGVQLAAPADALARRRADPPADRGEGVRLPRDRVGLPETSLRDQRDVLAGLRVDRARLPAGEVPFEPVAAHVSHGRYFAISKSAVTVPATVTAFVVPLSFGCQTFSV